MQTAQMNSPRFSYQTAAPTVANAPHTLDDFRPVHGSYAGSFSGKSKQPVWIAVGMIAVVAGIATGVNMYSESHAAKIDTAVSAPNHRVQTAPTAPAIAPTPVQAPVAKEIAAPDVTRSPAASTEVIKPVAPKSGVAAKSAPLVSKKVAPITAAPANAIVTPQPEVVPPSPSIVEPLPTPAPIIIEKPVVPAPAPAPEAPAIEPPKL